MNDIYVLLRCISAGIRPAHSIAPVRTLNSIIERPGWLR